jgi:hypothetical protein
VPTQTLPNRSFFHASSSSGFVVNQGQGGYGKWPLSNNAPTIFNRLSDAGKTWRVYYDATQIVPMTALIHGSMLDQYWDKNFYTMDEFYQDVANGTLPAYAFVEPRSLYNNNDYHPPAPLAPNVPIGGWSDVRAGDLLAHDIYTAVKASVTITGSNALNTLLLVTFDEHGNCFDHVAPPTATTPQNPQPEGELNFFFDRLWRACPHDPDLCIHGGGLGHQSTDPSWRRRAHPVHKVQPRAPYRPGPLCAGSVGRDHAGRAAQSLDLAHADSAHCPAASARARATPPERSREDDRGPRDRQV